MAETEQLRPAPLSLLIVMALLLAGLGYWAVATYQARNAEQRLGAALEAIGKDIGAKGGAVVLERDASRHVVKAVGVLPSETVRRDLEQAIHAQLPGYALDALVVTATGSAASLDAALAARLDRLEATLAETRIESERRLAATARQLSLDIQRAADSASDVASQVRRSREILSARLGSYAVFFRTNTAYRSLEQASATIDAVAAALNESSEAKVRVVGHGDLIGSRAATLEIARIRANKVASDLVQRGIDLGRIVVAARDGSREIVEVNGIGSSNRRVTFELVFPGE